MGKNKLFCRIAQPSISYFILALSSPALCTVKSVTSCKLTAEFHYAVIIMLVQYVGTL